MTDNWSIQLKCWQVIFRTSPTVQLQPLYTSVFIRLTHSDWLFQGIACQKALMGKGCGLASKMPQQQCPLMKVLKSSTRPLIPLLTTKCQSNWSRIFYVFDVRLEGEKMSIKTFTTLSRGLTKLPPGYLVWIHHFQDLWTTNCYFFDLKKTCKEDDKRTICKSQYVMKSYLPTCG